MTREAYLTEVPVEPRTLGMFAAQERVREHFLSNRHLQQYAELLAQLGSAR
jgi:hypothetical protein